jgi:hypothetical protein
VSAPVNPIVRMRQCAGCPLSFATPHGGGWPAAYHSAACAQAAARARAPKASPRQPLVTRPSTAKRRPISVASTEQRAKRAAGSSIVSGATTGLDAAHLCPRGLGGCDDADCTVALTRAEHRAFDAGELDLLPYLVAHQCHAEIAHALGHYRCDLIALLERLTGDRWTSLSIGAGA